jgi:hypothetical protein
VRYLDERGEWFARCAFVLAGGHEAFLPVLRDTMSAAWRFYDWVSAAEDAERYLMRILLNELRQPRPDDGVAVAPPSDDLDARQHVVLALRYWAGFGDPRIAELVGCRTSTVRRLVTDGLRHGPERELRDAFRALADTAPIPPQLRAWSSPPNRSPFPPHLEG